MTLTDPDPGQPDRPDDLAGRLLDAEIHDVTGGQATATCRDIDGGDRARDVFGQLPDEATAGDQLRVLYQGGELTLVAWQPA